MAHVIHENYCQISFKLNMSNVQAFCFSFQKIETVLCGPLFFYFAEAELVLAPDYVFVFLIDSKLRSQPHIQRRPSRHLSILL